MRECGSWLHLTRQSCRLAPSHFVCSLFRKRGKELGQQQLLVLSNHSTPPANNIFRLLCSIQKAHRTMRLKLHHYKGVNPPLQKSCCKLLCPVSNYHYGRILDRSFHDVEA